MALRVVGSDAGKMFDVVNKITENKKITVFVLEHKTRQD
jgi:hypothetical protein